MSRILDARRVAVVCACCAVAALSLFLAPGSQAAGDPADRRSRQKVTVPSDGGAAQIVPPASVASQALDAGGRVIRDLGPEGVRDALPPGGAPSPAGGPTCPPAGVAGESVRLDSVAGDRRVDSCGNFSDSPAVAAAPATSAAAAGGAPTIDRMTTRASYSRDHRLGDPLVLFASADVYTLSDGGSWQSGAGSYTEKKSYLGHVEVVGGTVRYFFSPPPDGLVYQQTDYDSGDHSAQGSLGAVPPLVLEATIGSATATMRGSVSVVSNDPTWYGEPRFNYYSAIPGSQVPFELTYTLLSGKTWQPASFDSTFSYTCTGWVDFAHPTAVPAIAALVLRGPAQVPPQASVQFVAVVQYANGVERDVSAAATWEADPSSVVSIAGGVLSTGTFAIDRQPITIRATYSSGGTTVSGSKSVLGRLTSSVTELDNWPMFQYDPRHTGYLPRQYEPDTFRLRWTKSLRSGYVLNPVASTDGRVFASISPYFGDGPALFALDARDGETLWSQAFGSPFSINPPSSAYGTVYIQTCNHSSDTWLHAFDAATGELVFRAPFEAQWERYYAPTIYDGTVYIDGGYYGGMYAFDAFGGVQRWFADLPQYDEWTPAVSGDLVYAYLGEYRPGLYVLDRHTGQQRVFIADPNFDWNGWSMDLAPLVLDNGDVVAIHDRRLIRFDLAGRRIAWERRSAFSGQPSFAHGVLYAVDGNRLVALDPATGAEQWAWSTSTGTLESPFIVTDSHVFVSTATTVFAVDLLSRAAAWSYPAGGLLALGDDNLYVAQSNGTLTTIAAAPYAPSPPVSLEIRGPDQVVEMTSVNFGAFVHYADGRVRDRTRSATWSVAPSNYASISAAGVLAVSEMLDLAQDVTITARYTDMGITVEAKRTVHMTVGVTVAQFVERNRARAAQIQTEVVRQLDLALQREQAIFRALDAAAGSKCGPQQDPYRIAIGEAYLAGRIAKGATQAALHKLDDASKIPPPVP